MDITMYIQNFIPGIDSPEKIYELFRGLGYQKDKILDPTYMRKDSLDEVLQDKKLDLIWGVWGERRYKAKENVGLHEFAKKHQSYKVFQSIINYRDVLGTKKGYPHD